MIINAQSWLAPNGKFHPCGNHMDYLDRMGLYRDNLYNNGWQRITYMGDCLYSQNSLKTPPNFKQKSQLKDLAIMCGFNIIQFDNDEDLITLWQSDE